MKTVRSSAPSTWWNPRWDHEPQPQVRLCGGGYSRLCVFLTQLDPGLSCDLGELDLTHRLDRVFPLRVEPSPFHPFPGGCMESSRRPPSGEAELSS